MNKNTGYISIAHADSKRPLTLNVLSLFLPLSPMTPPRSLLLAEASHEASPTHPRWVTMQIICVCTAKFLYSDLLLGHKSQDQHETGLSLNT
ncbi:hypothetical protein H671_8g19728 [Cricetulus griseus]|nr:hypothetical protein H671_8g19728 [Cricetulus griseus]